MKRSMHWMFVTVVLGVLIFGLMQFTGTKPAYGMLPCCDGIGGYLCDLNSSWWDFPTWSCNDYGEEIFISAQQCYDGWHCHKNPPPHFVTCEPYK